MSITASVPSSTALATSLTSARVGTGLVIMDSIIWVARDRELVQLARHADHALLQRRHGGVAHLDRQVAARDHDAVGGLAGSPRGCGIASAALDLGDQPAWLAGRRRASELDAPCTCRWRSSGTITAT
jgi:hypothetical protein